jgi:hypothetical protein
MSVYCSGEGEGSRWLAGACSVLSGLLRRVRGCKSPREAVRPAAVRASSRGVASSTAARTAHLVASPRRTVPDWPTWSWIEVASPCGSSTNAETPIWAGVPTRSATSEKAHMADARWMPGSSPMPPDARAAALATFARIIRERHPGVTVLPIADKRPNGTVAAPSAREVVRPFAAPEDRDPALDSDASTFALDARRIT